MKKEFIFKAVAIMFLLIAVICLAISTRETTIDPLFEKNEIIIDSFPELDSL